MYTSKRNVRVIGMSLLLFLICSLHGWAQEGELTITATDPMQTIVAGTDYSYENGVLTIKSSTPVTITSEGIKTSDCIAIEDGKTATVTINNVYIEANATIFDIKGNASVTLKLVGENKFVLTSDIYCIICCKSQNNKTASLTIEGTGTLIAENSGLVYPDINVAIIGGDADYNGGNCGNITIRSGAINIKTAKNTHYNSAIIGGGYKGNSGNINISGGVITIDITSSAYAAIGSGSSYSGNQGSVYISGGIIICNKSINSAKTSITGNPFIMVTKIEDKSNKVSWSGVIFEENAGQVYGTPTLPDGALTIPSGKTLTIEASNALTIGKNTTLINEGTIVNNGTITNEGVIGLKGTLTNNTQDGNTAGNIYKLGSGTSGGTYPLSATDGVLITFNGNAGSEAVYNLPSPQVIAKGGHPTEPSKTPTRANYTFRGWSASNNGPLISDWTVSTDADKTIYALWKYKTKLSFDNTELDGTYYYTYGDVPTVKATAAGASGTAPTGSCTYSYYSDAQCQNKINTPTDAGTYYVKATYPGDENNEQAEISTQYKISQKGLSVKTGTITKEYDGDNTVTLPTFTLDGVVKDDELDVTLNTSSYKLEYSKTDVGTDIPLTVTNNLSLSGKKANNYTLVQPSDLKGAITPKEVSIKVNAITKEYDGKTNVNTPSPTLEGVLDADKSYVDINTNDVTLTYKTKDVGANKSLSISGEYSLSGEKSGNYKLTQPTGLTGDITAKELTITPITNQTIYKDEHPVYTYSGQVGDEKPAFKEYLGVSQGKIIVDKLTLDNNDVSGFKATNYTLKLSSTDVTITVEGQKLEDAYTTEATKISSGGVTDWHKAAVTLTPTEGFKIKQVSSNLLKSSTDEWKDNLVVDGNDGTYEVTYQLKRVRNIPELDAQTAPSTEQNLTVQLDKTVPVVAVATNKLTATVTLSDATSGLASCEYTWNKGGNVTESIVAGAKSHSITLTATAAGSYPLEIKVTDKAGNETKKTETIVLKEGTPPTPPTPPTPVYTYYDVTLPAVEGATTDPKAGTHKVMEGNRFIFSLTLDADYSESVPLVTIDGTVLTPRESDGKYVTERIWSDQTIEISGIVKNTPTANEDLNASATHIYQTEGTLCIDIPQPLEGKVYSASGTELRTLRLSAGTNRVYGLPLGVCFVCLSDGTREKVIIATH